MKNPALRSLLALATLFLVSGCATSSVREDREFIAALNAVNLTGAWQKNPPEFKEAVFSAVFKSTRQIGWRSAVLLWEGSLSPAVIHQISQARAGDRISDQFPPVDTIQHVGTFCVDVIFQKIPAATRLTARSLFVCSANNHSLELFETGRERLNDLTRQDFMRLVEGRIED